MCSALLTGKRERPKTGVLPEPLTRHQIYRQRGICAWNWRRSEYPNTNWPIVISELHRRSHCGVLPPAALLVANDLRMAINGAMRGV
jgi:hypothetical protein